MKPQHNLGEPLFHCEFDALTQYPFTASVLAERGNRNVLLSDRELDLKRDTRNVD